MSAISTLVFFDIETTGLPYQERNQTKIIEACFVAVHRKDIVNSKIGIMPPLNKLSLLLNPQRSINKEVEVLTGLTNKFLENASLFVNKVNTVKSFLEDLPKPVCLIAHNGNSFDFKILRTECIDASANMPVDLKCADSIVGFRKIFKNRTIDHTLLLKAEDESILTDDEDEWPSFNVSIEDWKEIDDLTLSDTSFNDETENLKAKSGSECSLAEILNKRDEIIQKIFSKKSESNVKKPKSKESFSLGFLYKKLLNKHPVMAHRAEADCLMLVECVIALKNDFLAWHGHGDINNKLLTEIKPLNRY